MVSVLALLAGCGGEQPPWHAGVAASPPVAPATAAAEPTGTPVAEPTATPTGSTASPTTSPSARRKRSPAPKRTSPAPPTPGTDTAAGNRRYVFPVKGRNVSYHPTHSAYPATDLFANCGTPVVAVTDGTILEVSRVDRYKRNGPQGPLNGGKSVSLLGADGVRYYGSHLTVVDTGIEAGVRVRAGQRLGTVGKTGNANNVCHLHFGISPPCARTGDWQVRRGVVWPASFLDSWRANGRRSPVAKVAAWQDKHNCKP